jgi:hypothetical protein
MDTLNLTIKQAWLFKILSGEKTIEYRSIKPYYNRILGTKKLPFRLAMIGGYSSDSPKISCVVDRITANLESREYELSIVPGSARMIR